MVVTFDGHIHLLFCFVFRETCTLPGPMVQSVHVAYDKWGLMPPYPLNCIQVIYEPRL